MQSQTTSPSGKTTPYVAIEGTGRHISEIAEKIKIASEVQTPVHEGTEKTSSEISSQVKKQIMTLMKELLRITIKDIDLKKKIEDENLV